MTATNAGTGKVKVSVTNNRAKTLDVNAGFFKAVDSAGTETQSYITSELGELQHIELVTGRTAKGTVDFRISTPLTKVVFTDPLGREIVTANIK
ncbi:DUF4352 domain-containing protein [Actinomadura barringtoniae]|uniref:DUF4352 domain-containing protein n=1 Tax=Actinomadura barringtoniae TaxID=1427535 RepID=A0A939P9K2_9ACTN|nr:DUF4352 domain-containing protein [Actinomadura barringtoniae]MBO2448662.1 DUF4352 domain-containing protein [Actinomadura barringtoniae]